MKERGWGACIARRRREAPWLWVSTDDNAARCVPQPRDAASPIAGRSKTGFTAEAVGCSDPIPVILRV